MPIAGKGMLLTSMNVDAADEAEFNRWYDREHLEERVAIPGFLEARRYVAHDGSPKYLSLYSTETFEVLDSPAYRAALANQTAWSKANIARFKDMIRGVARITISRGVGRVRCSASSACVPAGGDDDLRAALREQLDPAKLDGIISMHLLGERPRAVEAAHRQSIGVLARRWRLVRADRCHRCKRNPGRRGALCRVQIADGIQRHLQADVRSRQERSRAPRRHAVTASGEYASSNPRISAMSENSARSVTRPLIGCDGSA